MSLFSFLFVFLLVLTRSQVLLTGDAVLITSQSYRFSNTAFNRSLSNFITDFYNILGYVPLFLNSDTNSKPCSIEFSHNNPSNLPIISSIYIGTFDTNPYATELLGGNITTCYSGKGI